MPSKKTCYDYAIGYISRFPKTEKELRAKLREKGYEDDNIERTMHLLKRDDYINDEKYVRMYIESEVIRKGKPLWTIAAKLNQKGADKHLIDEIGTEYECDIREGVKSGINKHIDKLLARGNDVVSIVQKLQRKGYKYDQVIAALKAREVEGE
jgi:regulatory protein